MKNLILRTIFIGFVAMVALAATDARAQSFDDQDEPAQPQRQRPNLRRALGLSQEQVTKIQELNATARPLRAEAQRRLREANRDLDQAIYAEVVDDALVAERLKSYQDAQAAVAKLNFENELAIRKLLTPEQLVRFREVRRRFAAAREEMQRRRRENAQQGLRPGAVQRRQQRQDQQQPAETPPARKP